VTTSPKAERRVRSGYRPSYPNSQNTPQLSDTFPELMFGNIQRMSGLPEHAVREIEQIHSKWLEFETAGDVRSFMGLCADDIELWPPDARSLIGREVVSASMARGTARIHSIEISERRIRGSNELAYLTANYKTTFSLGENSAPTRSSGSHLWILRRQAGRWVVTLVNWSRW
jgi:ketosteroid isomerase-like protein